MEDMKQMGYLDEDNRLKRLSAMGDPLEKVTASVEWSIFRPLLNEAYVKEDRKSPAGRPPWDYLMLFKVLLLQEWYEIADDNTEYLINDRLSFQRFLGLGLGDKVPDAKTIWLFRERLKDKGMGKRLFDMFGAQLEKEGVVTHKGSIVDATFTDKPRQRNSREENEAVKAGKTPEEWKKSPHKLRQKDVDARWTKKNEETHYGYKDHVKVDKDSKLITNFSVTDAAVHDSREIAGLIDEKDKIVYADSAYVGEEHEGEIRKKNKSIILKINEKGYRNRPLSDEQKAANKEKSRIRARVEHVFGFMSTTMEGIYIRCIGKARATLSITLKNLAYNLRRYAYLTGIRPASAG